MQREYGIPFNSEKISGPAETLRREAAKEDHWSFVKLLFLFGMLLTVVQQFPVIREVAYGEIRLVLYGLFGLLGFYCFARLDFGMLPVFHVMFLFSIFLSSFLLIFLHFLHEGVSGIVEYRDLLDLIVAFGILTISLYLSFTPKQLLIIVHLYVVFGVFLGISLVYYYGDGWVITAQYFLKGKNQVGPIIAIAATLMVFILLKQNTSLSKYGMLISGFLLYLSLSSLLVLRNRNGLLAMFLVATVLLVSILHQKIKLETVLLVFLACFCLFFLCSKGYLEPIGQRFIDAFVMNYDLGDLESLSAGRVSVYVESLKFIHAHPLWGRVFSDVVAPRNPHNFVLNKWVDYGVVGSFPMVAFYLYMWFFTFKQMFSKKGRVRSVAESIPYLLLLPLITSMFEYTHPFGPGVSQIMVWFLLGQYIKEVRIQRRRIN